MFGMCLGRSSIPIRAVNANNNAENVNVDRRPKDAAAAAPISGARVRLPAVMELSRP